MTQQPLAWTWWTEIPGGATASGLAAASGVLQVSSAGGADWLSLGAAYTLAAFGFFVLSWRRLRRQLEKGQGSAAEQVVGTTKSHTPLRGNPLSWLVLKRFDPLLGLPRWPTLALAVGLTLAVEIFWPNSLTPAVLGVFGLVVMAWTFFWACVVSAQTWIEERVERTLELLLATPFTLDEIVLWKVDALFWALVSPTLIYSVLLFNLFTSSIGSPVFVKAFVLIPFAICIFLYSYVVLLVLVYLTIFFAIRSNSTVQAVLLTLGTLTGLVLFNFFAILLGHGDGILLAALVDLLLFVAFLPTFRGRLKSFEPR